MFDGDVVGILDRAQHLVGVHAVLGLDRREAVVHFPPSVEVRNAVADKSNRASHGGSLQERDALLRKNRLQETRATKARLRSLLLSSRRALRRTRWRAWGHEDDSQRGREGRDPIGRTAHKLSLGTAS